jgi:23S rRNA G2069 N7-methylase RlmK/C1962 C5-methylase RlmI
VTALDLDRVQAALARRASFVVPQATTLRRLVDGAGDDLEGVVVDGYGDVVRVELWRAEWPENLDALAALLRAHGARGVVAVLRTGAGQSSQRVIGGDVPAAHVVVEDGVRLLVRVADDAAVGAGAFVDQRLGRRVVRDAARGRVVVNFFAHAGAFGAAAAVGAAARVDHVDMAKKCAPWAATNLALNGVDPRGHRFIVDDALEVLARLAKKPGSAGVVILDPPTQGTRRPKGRARGSVGRFVAKNALVEMATQACRALDDGGVLLLSVNDRDVSVSAVVDAAGGGAFDAGRAIDSVVALDVPEDITSAEFGRARPMRGAVLRLR